MNSYILWDKNAELFSWGSFTLRWDGLMLLLAFIMGKQMLVYIYKKENKPAKDVDLLITYLVIAVFISSRLAHVILYQQELWHKPLSIFFPIEFKPTFHITGMTGFSSVGGVVGIFIAIWLVNSVAEPPRVRRPTKPTYGSRQRRLEGKAQRAETKALRGRVVD